MTTAATARAATALPGAPFPLGATLGDGGRKPAAEASVAVIEGI